MPRPKQVFTTNVWAPGLTKSTSPVGLEPGQAPIADNVDLSRPGILRRRAGWSDIEADFSAGSFPNWLEISRMADYHLAVSERQGLPGPPSDNYHSLVAVVGPELWHSDPAEADTGKPSVGTSWAKLGTLSLRSSDSFPLNSDIMRPMFAKLGQKLYIVKSYGGAGGFTGNHISGPIDSWDTVTFTADIGGGSPECSIIATYGSALVVAGIDGNESRIQWSGLEGTSGPDTWPAANFFDLDEGDGDVILGLGVLHNSLFVFKRHSIWRVTGQLPDDGALAAGTVSVVKLGGELPGCIAPRSLVSTGEEIIYLSQSGVFSFDGQTTTELTRGIRDVFITLLGVEPWLTGDGLDATGYYDRRNNRYILSFPTFRNTGDTDCIAIELGNGALSSWSGSLADLTSHVRMKDGDYVGFLDGKIGILDNATTDDGDPIVWDYLTGVLAITPEADMKITRMGHVLAKPTDEDITFQVVGDFSTASFPGDYTPDLTDSSGAELVYRVLNLTNKGRNIQLRITGDGLDTAVIPEVHRVNIELHTTEK